MRIDKCSFDLKKEVQNIVKLVTIQAQLKKQRIQIVYENSLPLYIISDPNRMKQVLFNLLTNAVTNGKEGGEIKVTVSRTKINKIRHAIRIEVKDNGPGIPEEIIKDIFTIREKETKSRRIALGLPISYKICQKLGGKLKLKSIIDKGTTFSFKVEMHCTVITINNSHISPDDDDEYPETICGFKNHEENAKIHNKSSSPKYCKTLLVPDNKRIGRMSSLLVKPQRHPTPESFVEQEPSNKIEKTAIIIMLSKEISTQLRIRALSDMSGRKRNSCELEKERFNTEVRIKSDFTGKIKKKMAHKDMQSVISDAIRHKNDISTNALNTHHLITHNPFKPRSSAAINIIREQLIDHIKLEKKPIPDESVEFFDDAQDNQIMPKILEPNTISSAAFKNVAKSCINVHNALENNTEQVFNLETIINKIAKKIIICEKCKCPSILIVDDNDFNRFSLEKQLLHLGFVSEQASNGQICVQKVYQRSGCACKGYKLVFMDYDMPVMDGVEATKRIVQGMACGKISKNIIIVGVSAFSSRDEIEACMRAGMKDFSILIISYEALLN